MRAFIVPFSPFHPFLLIKRNVCVGGGQYINFQKDKKRKTPLITLLLIKKREFGSWEIFYLSIADCMQKKVKQE